MIVFFGAGIRYYLSDRSGGHEVQPGQSYSYNVGLSFALSEKSTLGLQVNGAYSNKLIVDRRRVPESQLEPISVRVSLVQRVFAGTYLEPEFSAGLTTTRRAQPSPLDCGTASDAYPDRGRRVPSRRLHQWRAAHSDSARVLPRPPI